MTTGLRSFAQETKPHFCGTESRLQQLYAEHPELEEDYRQFFQNNLTVVKGGEQTRFIYKIPVVFHILHEYGIENITDAQVYDQMEILNEDYRKLNPDFSEVISEFLGIAADCEIEFQLATLDPWGQCTNGIEHIYSHQTNLGDDYSKLNQWHRSKYLNVWVCKSFEESGLQAYAFYPTAVEGSFFWADGVIMLHQNVGHSGTAEFGNQHILTHEIAHWMGLPHIWGSNNDPMTGCGDDGIADTPITAGHQDCTNLLDDNCVPGVIENVQNYMDYSGCNRMFTEGQAAFMTNTLLGQTAQRNNLWTEATHTATGINVIPPPTCIPAADFSSDERTICAGDQIQFTDASWRAGVTAFNWTFPGGTPATSTDANPLITYNTPGYYNVKLRVSNSAGADSMIFENMIFVSGNWSDFTGPVVDDYESVSANWWLVQNPENNYGVFHQEDGVGKDLSNCYALRVYRDLSQVDPFTEDWFYNGRLGGSKDNLISPSYNLSTTSNVSVSFDYAYGTKATAIDDVTEVLRVYSSRDCGKTWQLRTTIDGSDLLTVGYVGNTDFAPVSNSEWKTATFTYNANSTDVQTRFRWEMTASDKSNNFFIDNINIDGTLSISEADASNALITVAPNPVQAGSAVSVTVENVQGNLELQLTDINGALVSTTAVGSVNGTQTVQIPVPVAKGCYFLNAVQGNMRSTHRVIVF